MVYIAISQKDADSSSDLRVGVEKNSISDRIP